MRALDPLAIPLHGLRLIEASAGTGKTHTISTLYLRALLELDLEVSQLLVVTFTNAATEELRDRIRGRLRQALTYLNGVAEPDPELRKLLDTQEDVARVHKRLTDCVTLMDEASVFTIHGFCQRTLREHAFESGTLFDQSLDGDDRALRTELVRDFWRLQLGRASGFLASWASERWNGPDQLEEKFSAVPMNRDVRLEPAVDEAALAKQEEALRLRFASLRGIWSEEAGQIGQLLHPGPNLNQRSYPVAAVNGALESMGGFLAADVPVGRLPYKYELFTVEKLRSATRKHGQTPEHRFFQNWSDFVTAHLELDAMRQAWFLTQAVGYVRDKLRVHSSTGRTVSYDDLLTNLHDALRGPAGMALAGAIRQRYPVALIDEFQDTDDLQYGIFARVYGGSTDGALFLIGDPKQAIYGFRGADIFTYIKAARAADAAGGRYTLGTNWRSASALVKAVNTLFTRATAPFVFEGDIPFLQVDAAGRADGEPLVVEGDDAGPFRLWWLPRQVAVPGRGERPIPKALAEQMLAIATAREVGRLLTLAREGRARLGERPLASGDIAILVRSRFEASVVREALHTIGLTSVFLTRESVFHTEDAQELRRVLVACAEPSNERFVRAALCTRLIGYSVSQIADLREDGARWDETVGRFFGYHELWRRGNLLGALRRMLEDHCVVPRYVTLRDGERRLTNLLQLAELLERESRARPGADRLLRWLAARRAGGAGGPDEEQLRLESDEGLVKIVTLHSSKGLEYPVVFLPFSWSTRSVTAAGIVCFHDDDGLVADLCPEPAGSSVDAADRERLAEDVRLLYVGLTRAIHRCYVGWGVVTGSDQSAMAYLLHRGRDPSGAPSRRADAELGLELAALEADAAGGIAVQSLSEPGPPMSFAAEAGVADVVRRPFQGEIERDFRLASYSGLIKDAIGSGERPDRDDSSDALPQAGDGADVPAFRFPRGPRAGTFLHAVLEQLDFPFAKGASLRATIERALTQHGMDPCHVGDVTWIVNQVLDTPLDHSGALNLRAVGKDARRDEMEFHFPLGRLDVEVLRDALGRSTRFGEAASALQFDAVRGFMRGFMDLVFEWEGCVYLVDYKSNHLGNALRDYGEAGVSEAMIEHRYDLQYLIYTVALDRYLAGRIPGYDYERHFGGVFYLFLRGMRPEHGPRYGVFHDRPERELVTDLGRVFAGAGR